MSFCKWCNKSDQHGPENEEGADDDYCNHCEFCEANICCECWDADGTCYYPGEGYCPTCKLRLFECANCVAYLNGLMSDPDMAMCDKHWNKDSPDYIGKFS